MSIDEMQAIRKERDYFIVITQLSLKKKIVKIKKRL